MCSPSTLPHPCPASISQDAFRAFHPDLDVVGKFLKPLLIGELAPEEPSLDRGKNVSRACMVGWGLEEVGLERSLHPGDQGHMRDVLACWSLWYLLSPATLTLPCSNPFPVLSPSFSCTEKLAHALQRPLDLASSKQHAYICMRPAQDLRAGVVPRKSCIPVCARQGSAGCVSR